MLMGVAPKRWGAGTLKGTGREAAGLGVFYEDVSGSGSQKPGGEAGGLRSVYIYRLR